ncbi:MAG: DMT family transporter [Verrucomicrobiota bacterium]
MIGALLTPLFFAFSAVTGQRVAVRLGAVRGNLVRLGIATVILGILVALFWPESIARETFKWYFVSGLIGFGLGDVALFLAYERLGSRLTILLSLCLAPLFAMVIEWMWLGNGVSMAVMVCAAVILTGVTMAIRPGAKSRQQIERRGNFLFGVCMAVTAGFGQGAGAVISRKAEEIAVLNGVMVNGISAAFQRVFAGLIFAIVAMIVVRWVMRRKFPNTLSEALTPNLVPWLMGAALFGPVIGVSCFQWALLSLESGIVLAITAMTPIVLMPLAAVTERDHPSRLAIAGAVIAVTGVALLYLWA